MCLSICVFFFVHSIEFRIYTILREAHYLFYLFRGSLFDIWVKCKIYENNTTAGLIFWTRILKTEIKRERERVLRVFWRVRSAYCFENLTLRLFNSSQIHSSCFIRFLYSVVYTTNTIIKIWTIFVYKSGILEGSWNFHFTLTIQFGSCTSYAITVDKK